MITRRWTLLACLGLGLGAAWPVPASAQVIEQLQKQLQEMIQPAPVPAQDDYRGRRGDEFRQRMPGNPPRGLPDERAQRWEEIRARMFEFREACQDGDRRSCIRLGIIIGENRERRAQWRREHPDLFWWER